MTDLRRWRQRTHRWWWSETRSVAWHRTESGCLVQSKTPSCAWRLLTSFLSFPPPPAPLLFSPDKLLHLSAGSFITIRNWDISIVATGILRNRPVIESIDAPPEPVQHRALWVYLWVSKLGSLPLRLFARYPSSILSSKNGRVTPALDLAQAHGTLRLHSILFFFFRSSSFSLFYFAHQFHCFAWFFPRNLKCSFVFWTTVSVPRDDDHSSQNVYFPSLIDHRIILQLVVKHHRHQTLRRSINREVVYTPLLGIADQWFLSRCCNRRCGFFRRFCTNSQGILIRTPEFTRCEWGGWAPLFSSPLTQLRFAYFVLSHVPHARAADVRRFSEGPSALALSHRQPLCYLHLFFESVERMFC